MSKKHARRPWLALATIVALVSLAPGDAAAHFTLMEPESWRAQDILGNPQKLGPCGDDGSAAMSGAITEYQTGQTITVSLDETIFHPGWYRVALSVNDRSELPPEPIVTPGSDSPCGTVEIMDPPVFPVLADGVLVHTASLSGAQTFEVTLPPGVTCDHCTLQIIEFMQHHPLNMPGGCFYHHCADISIHDAVATDAAMSEDTGMIRMADTGTSAGTDAGVGTGMDGGAGTPPARASCGCAAPGRDAGGLGWLALVPLALFASRRRASVS